MLRSTGAGQSRRFIGSITAAAVVVGLTTILTTGLPGALPTPAPAAAAPDAPTTAWHDNAWHVNTPDAVRHDNIVLTASPTLGRYSMPVGNGSAGAAVWGQNGFTAQLNRVDTMPDRRSAGWLTIPGLAPMTDADDYHGTVDLYDATFRQSGGGMTATTYMRADKDQLIVEVTGANPATPQSATVDLQSGRRPTAVANGSVGVLAETWVDRASYTGGTGKTFGSLAALTSSAADTVASTPTSNSARIQFHPAADGSFRIIVGIPHYAGGDPLEVARDVLGTDVTAPSAELAAGHLGWWHDYWNRADLVEATSADGDADFMANLRTIYLYVAGSSERGEYPATQAGVNPLFNFSRDTQQWGGGHYWFWNLRMQLAANLSSGLSELNGPFLHMYSSDLPAIEQWTRTNYAGTKGICLPETMRFDGTGWYVGTGNGNASCYPSETSYNAKTQTSAAELASWVWRQYEMDDDKQFLARYYPIIAEAAKFLLSVTTVGEDGKLHTFSNAHETQWDVRDPITDIAAMKMVFPIAIRATQILDADDTLVADLKAALPRILDFPRTDRETHRLLKTATDDGDGNTVLGISYEPTAARHNSENLDLEPVWPYNLISDTGPQFDLAKATFASRLYRNSNSWTYDAVDAARLDLGDEVSAALHRQAASFTKYPSGLAAFSSNMTEPYDETDGVVSLALNESLATDYDGLLRIAPAVPPGWDMAGTISLKHRSKVHVQVSDGTVTTVAIESGSNHALEVRNPWPGQQIRVVDSRGRLVVRPTDAETIEFNAHTGGAYVVEQVAHPLADQAFAPLGGQPATAPRQLAGSTSTIGLLTNTQVHCATPTQPLLVSWDPTSGTTVTDSSSYHRNGTFAAQAPAYASDGPTSSAAVLDGGYLTAGSTVMGYLKEATFAAEVKPTAPDGYRRIWDWKTGSGGDDDGVIVDLTPSNQLRLITAGKNTTFSTALPADQWADVVTTVSVDGVVDVYVDGSRVAGTTLSTPGVDGCRGGTLRLGADQGGGQRLTGEVDRAAIFARALTPAEIAHWQTLNQ